MRPTPILSAVVLTVATYSWAQSTSVGPAFVHAYRLNTPSFSSLNWSGGVVPAEINRSISFAANHWAAYAGARVVFERTSETNLTGCIAGEPLIVAARPSCATGGSFCSTAAWYQTCTNGAEIIFWQGGAVPLRVWTTKPRLVDERDLTATATHEFGHIILAGPGQDMGGHLTAALPDAFRCSNSPGGRPVLGGFCEREIRTVGRSQFGLTGVGYLGRPLATTTTAGANLPYFPTPTSTSVWSGIGGAELVFGKDVYNPAFEWLINATTKVNVTAALNHPVQFAPDNAAWDVPVIDSDIVRPVVVWDPIRVAWWIFVRETSTGVGGSGAETSRVHVFKGTPGVSGLQDRGFLSHPSLGIQSRYPIGAAYDPSSTFLVIVWNDFEGNNDFEGDCATGFSGHQGSGAWLAHCQTEILAAVLDPNAVVGLPVVAVQRFKNTGAADSSWGFAGLGSPTVVCDPGVGGNQCEVYVVNPTQFKEITTWKICATPTSICGYSQRSSERINSPGETDFPISVSPRRFDGTGVLVEAVTGGDRNIWYRSKANVTVAYPGWTGPMGPRAMTGPTVRRRLTADNYTITYGRE